MPVSTQQEADAWVAPTEPLPFYSEATGWVYPEGMEVPTSRLPSDHGPLSDFGLYREEFMGEVHWVWHGPDVEWALTIAYLLGWAVFGACSLAPAAACYVNRNLFARAYFYSLAATSLVAGLASTTSDAPADEFFAIGDAFFAIAAVCTIALWPSRNRVVAWTRCLAVGCLLGFPGILLSCLDEYWSAQFHTKALVVGLASLCYLALRGSDTSTETDAELKRQKAALIALVVFPLGWLCAATLNSDAAQFPLVFVLPSIFVLAAPLRWFEFRSNGVREVESPQTR